MQIEQWSRGNLLTIFMMYYYDGFPLEKKPKNLNFRSVFTSKDPLMDTFNGTHAPTSRKYIAKQGIVMPN